MNAEHLRTLRLKREHLIAEAEEADARADEYQAADRSPRVIAAKRAQADKLRDFARDVEREISAARVTA